MTGQLGNHDRARIADKFGAGYVEALNLMLLTLRGTPTCYYGDELGMQGISVTFEQTQDPFGKNFGPVSPSANSLSSSFPHRVSEAYKGGRCRSPEWKASEDGEQMVVAFFCFLL